MPPTETPPNPVHAAPPPPPPAPVGPVQAHPAPIKIVTRRIGELDHTELANLLDTLQGDQAKARFRESIYISIIFYLLLAWLIVYGPKYIFHPGNIVDSAATRKAKEHLTELNMQNDIAKLKPAPKPPVLNHKALEQLQAMQRANQEARAAAIPPPALLPQPAAAPTPAPAVAEAPPPPPLPAAPTPQPPPRPTPAPTAAIPDAPHSNLPAAPSVSRSMNDAANAPANSHLGPSSAIEAPPMAVGKEAAAGDGVEILSATPGIDYTRYLRRLHTMIESTWLPLIPEEVNPPISKDGWTVIRITIDPNGTVSAMHLDDSSHDRAIDKAAWGGITGNGQFPPHEGGPLELRYTFQITHTRR